MPCSEEESAEAAERVRHTSGASYQSRAEQQAEQQARRQQHQQHQYRSRSDLERDRRYASQTLLDGARPGPIASHSRRDALHSLQRELDSLSRFDSRADYAADLAQDSLRSRSGQRVGAGFANYEYGNGRARSGPPPPIAVHSPA